MRDDNRKASEKELYGRFQAGCGGGQPGDEIQWLEVDPIMGKNGGARAVTGPVLAGWFAPSLLALVSFTM